MWRRAATRSLAFWFECSRLARLPVHGTVTLTSSLNVRRLNFRAMRDVTAGGQSLGEEQFDQHRQDDERQAEQDHAHEPAFDAGELQLVAHHAAEALGKELAA